MASAKPISRPAGVDPVAWEWASRIREQRARVTDLVGRIRHGDRLHQEVFIAAADAARGEIREMTDRLVAHLLGDAGEAPES